MSVVQTDDDGAQARARSELEEHYGIVLGGLRLGMVTPMLGAAASLFGRLDAVDWHGAPSAEELASRLAEDFEAHMTKADLLGVAQWIYALRGGSGQLYRDLHQIFDCDFPTTRLHEFIAGIPRRLEERNVGKPLLIVTTNYDDLMERALADQGADFDLIVYMADGPDEGFFCHRAPGGELTRISEDYTKVDPDKRTVVLKLHGFVCRDNARRDSYVITEDHYIEYLTRTDLKALLPPAVVGRLLDCHLLFLGYSLRDWNLRAILYRLSLDRLHDNDWWGVQLNPDPVELKSWQNRSVQIFNTSLEHYLDGLVAAFDAWLAKRPIKGQVKESK